MEFIFFNTKTHTMKKLLFILSIFLVNYSIAQKIGNKVSIVAVDGKTYTGVITDIQGGKYKVRYDGYNFDSWLTANQFTLLQSSPPIPNNSNNQAQNQTTYKVGDAVEVMSAGSWVKAKILEVKGGGEYLIREERYGIEYIERIGKFLRPIKANPQTNDRNNQATNNGSMVISNENSVGEKYGTREPRICGDTRAPLKGAITAELAAKYFMCQAEGEWSDNLYLVEDVKVQVGGGIPYSAIMGQRSLNEIDVRQPVYPVRGTYTKYQYRRIYNKGDKPYANVSNVKADGYCYKTTFGDWKCYF